jgi:PPM family protein phosphatase
MSDLKHYAISFTGRRDNNQDACTVLKLGNGTYFLAVADGMGGVHGGQVASNLILQNAQNILNEIDTEKLEADSLKEILENIFTSSQKVLYEKVQEQKDLAGMGTTLTAVLIKNDKFAWGNIGDSRTYLLRDKILKQLSVDHTYVEDYRQNNGDDIPDSIIEQYSHYLTRAIDGGADEAEIYPSDKNYETLIEGDLLFLCSDGMITNKVHTDNETFTEYLLYTSSGKEAAQNLISYAFESGSKDNISVVIAEYGEFKREEKEIKKYQYPPKDYATSGFFSNKYFRMYSIIIILLLLIISAILIFR